MPTQDRPEPASAEVRPPTDSAGRLFWRFLRFGLLAWGGPVAQIDMIRHELVEEERWVSRDHFRRLLAIYQALPGPEAHELCVHFGMLARGRLGGVLAGLGFMLPGFILMFLLSWLYLRLDLAATEFQAVFLGIQPAVIALIIRACHRIGGHSLLDVPLWVITGCAASAQVLQVPFWLTLPLSGLAYVFAAKRRWAVVALCGLVWLGGTWAWSPVIRGSATVFPAVVAAKVDRDRGSVPSSAGGEVTSPPSARTVSGASGDVAPGPLFFSGLKAGLLTFGGAYTAIPFLERDAVEQGAWMTRRDFLDGVALSGILPAPLIIFATFVGFFGGGPWGALAMTVGVFLPAFLFTLLFFHRLEAVIANPTLRHFLEGITAGVVGLIATTTVGLAYTAIPDFRAAAIAAAVLVVIYRWKSKAVIPLVMLGAGLAGWVMFR